MSKLHSERWHQMKPGDHTLSIESNNHNDDVCCLDVYENDNKTATTILQVEILRHHKFTTAKEAKGRASRIAARHLRALASGLDKEAKP